MIALGWPGWLCVALALAGIPSALYLAREYVWWRRRTRAARRARRRGGYLGPRSLPPYDDEWRPR